MVVNVLAANLYIMNIDSLKVTLPIGRVVPMVPLRQ